MRKLVSSLIFLFAISSIVAPPTLGQAQRSDGSALVASESGRPDASTIQYRRQEIERLLDQQGSGVKTFHSSFRDEVLAKSILSTATFESTMAAGVIAPDIVGDQNADLVYTPVTPCRIFDSRNYGGGAAFSANSNRNVGVSGFSSYAFQGGSDTNCGGIPWGPAKVAMLNFVAIAPAGGGNLQAWPSDLTAPSASTLNFQKLTPNLNIANGVAVPICSSCFYELTVRANLSSVHVVIDMVGYFSTTRCGAGMTKFAGVCFENSTRTSGTFFTADDTCGTVGGRLPTAQELLSANPVLTLAADPGEWSSNIYKNGTAFEGILVDEADTIAGVSTLTSRPYRCVYSPLP
jgi:hypothetical protein